MEVDQFDNFNAPQFFDFANDVVPDDIDKFFDLNRGSQARRASSLPPKTPAKARKSRRSDAASPAVQENKENCTPPSQKRRSSSVPPSSKNTCQRGVLADISYSSTYATPSASSRKSHVSYLNGRSVLVQKYDGIQLVTPNKTHLMETRLDYVIKSPGLSLRSRSVSKPTKRSIELSQKTEEEVENESDVEMEEIPDQQEAESASNDEAAAAEPEIAEEAPPVIKKARSVVILPPQQTMQAKPLQAVKPMAPVAIAENKPTRIRHNVPMVVQHKPAAAMKPEEKAGPGKFQAAAELVNKFHKATPDRFHTMPTNQKLHVKNLPVVAGPRPNTIPKSPYFASKTRVRIEHIPSQADKEKAELEEMKKHQIKARPVPRQMLVPPVQKNIAVAKTQPTKPEPFKLTQVNKRREATPEPVYRFKANPVPRRMLQSPQGVPPRQEIPLTEPHTPALALNAKYSKRPKLDGIDLKKIGHGGVPIVKQMTPVKLTQVQPFSFEERDKEIQQKKMDLVQKQIEDEKVAREFRAGKKPNFARAPLLPEKKLMPVTVPHTPKLSTFTLGAKNTQKFYEKLAEEELKMYESSQFRAKPATVTQTEPFRPILPHRVIPDVELHLNTEKRALERAKFNEMLRIQEQENEAARQLLEQMREEEAREEELRMRKEAEFHANPIRKGTPLRIKPSERPLTDPQSPFRERHAKN